MDVVTYIGTYTGGGSRGLYVGGLDPETGRLSLTGTVVPLENPSFAALDPGRLRLYAVSEVDASDGRPGGAVHAFALDPVTGTPTPLGRAPSGGAAPCHVGVDPAGRFVVAANYGGGSVALLPLRPDGGLAGTAQVVPHAGSGPDPARQSGPHAHSITPDPAGRYALALDLGTDAIEVYDTDAPAGPALRPVARTPVHPGAGPRHLAFDPSGRFAYTVHELDSTLTAWRYDAAQGRLSALQTLSTLPDGAAGPNAPADIHVHPSGSFVYASNRGHDSLAVFAVEAETGMLSLRGVVPAGGRNPRGFAIDPAGRWLVAAHQDSGTLASFAIGPATGGLTPSGSVLAVPSPACVRLLCLPPGRPAGASWGEEGDQVR